jgi:uncharacterized protein YdiU (UPF0061 family)
MNQPEPNPETDTPVSLTFDNRFTRELPADPDPRNHRRQVNRACYSRIRPTPAAAPRLVAYARETAELLGLEARDVESDALTPVLAGNRLLPGMDPHAMCYGGHQFGHWARQLGDGRVINLGEVLNGHGEHWMLQLKGAGPTPYRRMGDGWAVLRSSVREFLCSEAMHHLGVPTTRALSLVTTGEQVERDMFYDGRPRPEPGAVVCRVAPSFIRFGNFELHAFRQETDVLRQLTEFTIRNHFPHLGDPASGETLVAWFREVCERTARMIVHWMRVGFVHGVMNTDNMSVLGLTIDYGPYGWLEDYDPQWTPNTTDAEGRRYCFGNQPYIAQWNLLQLANALYPLVEAAEPLEQALAAYAETFDNEWRRMMADKLGLAAFDPATDDELVEELVRILTLAETDMTLFYRALARLEAAGDSNIEARGDDELLAPLLHAYYQPDQLTPDRKARIGRWLRRYIERVRREGTPDAERRERMNAVNPKYVLRNYLAQQAIDKAEQGDPALIHELLDVLRRPYDEQPDKEAFAQKRPEWARHKAGCSMLSCSS